MRYTICGIVLTLNEVGDLWCSSGSGCNWNFNIIVNEFDAKNLLVKMDVHCNQTRYKRDPVYLCALLIGCRREVVLRAAPSGGNGWTEPCAAQCDGEVHR